ncbi:MAG: type IV secretion system DNA-binding domain-containing protein [Cyanobacteria bacterium P01_F01_bin.53]
MFNLSHVLSFRTVKGAVKWTYHSIWSALKAASKSWQDLIRYGPFPGLQVKIAALSHQPKLEHWIARFLPDWLEHALVLGASLVVMSLAVWIAALDPIGAVIGAELIWPLMNIGITFGIAVWGIDLYKEDVWLRRKIQPWVCFAAASVVAALSIIVPIPFMVGPAIAAAWWFPRRVHYLQVEDRPWQQDGVDHPLRHLPYGRVRRERLGEIPLGEEVLNWGGIHVPFQKAVYNFMIIGSIGSGKTIMLRLFLQSLLPHIHKGGSKRAIIFDPKRNFYSILKGMNPKTPIHILHPFDARHAKWDISHDINTMADCVMLAAALTPEQAGDHNPFWKNISRHMFTGILTYFYLNVPAGQWGFRDFLLASQSPTFLVKLFRSCPETNHYANMLGEDGNLTHNVMVTLQTYLAEYYIIASLWEQAAYKVSLKQWVKESSILLLGNSHQHQTILSAVNRLLFRLLKPIISDMPATLNPVAETAIILDEMARLNRLEDFEGFVNTARDKGVMTAIVFHTISDLENIYGPQEAKTLLSQFTYKAFFRLNDPTSDKWASDQAGTARRQAIRRENNMTVKPEFEWRNNVLREDKYEDGTTIYPMETTRVLQPGKLSSIPMPEPGKQGVKGYYIDSKNYWHTIPSYYISEHMKGTDKTMKDFEPFDTASVQILQPWSEEDFKRLNLPFSTEQMKAFGFEATRIMRDANVNTRSLLENALKQETENPPGTHTATTSNTSSARSSTVDETVTTDSGFDDGFATEASDEFPDLDPWV